MSTIFVISPMYLSSIIHEAKKFSFDLQGYGNFEAANKGLLKTNSCDILGFAFVADTLPRYGSEESSNFLNFIKKCDLLGESKKFTIVTLESIPSKYVSKLKKCTNVRFFTASGFEYITDTVIKTNVFGSILIDQNKPYKLEAEKQVSLKEFSCPTVKIAPVISDYVLRCIAPVSKLDNINQTCEYDEAYQDYLKNKSILAGIRKCLILNAFEEMCADKLHQYEEELLDLLSNNKIPPAYLAILEIVKEECL